MVFPILWLFVSFSYGFSMVFPMVFPNFSMVLSYGLPPSGEGWQRVALRKLRLLRGCWAQGLRADGAAAGGPCAVPGGQPGGAPKTFPRSWDLNPYNILYI